MTPPVSSQERLPVADGRYVVFVQCDGPQSAAWVHPIIALWHGGKWHVEHNRPVYGWIGPLPVLRVSDFAPASVEYDL